jgi:hypothetical protein
VTPFWLGLIGFVLVLGSGGAMLGLAFLRRKARPTFREIPAFRHLQDAIGRAVEDGSRLHVSLGRGGLISPQSASALAGLSSLRRLATLTAASDNPPIATAGDASLAMLSQETLRSVHLTAPAGTVFDPTGGRLTGLTPFSYAAGALPMMRDENVSASLLLGNFGPEAGLLTEAAERQGMFSLAASDSLPAQAIMYASAQDPLMGEELFAAGAYLDAGPIDKASLTVQDILRWLVVVVLLVGFVLKLAGVL